MDLSNQELPLTTHFSKLRAVPKKQNKPADSDSQPASRPSKRRRSNARGSVASPLNSTARQSKLRPTTLQLPTPATSTRKCVRDRRLKESRAEAQLGVATGQNAIRTSERDAALESGASSSRLRQLRHESTEDAVLELSNVTPSAGRHKPATMTIPQASSRSEFVHDTGHIPSVGYSCRLFRQPSRPPYQGPPCSPISSVNSDPFYTRQDVRVFAPRDHGVPALSEALDGQPSDGPVLPMLPVPSSQSQYLLHPDATPKRKRCYRRVEYVISSQLQEEEELTLSRLPKSTKDISSVVVSPGKYTPQRHHGRDERRSQRFHALGFTPVATSTNFSAAPSCSSAATNNASDKLSPGFSNSSRCKRSTPYHSPSCNSKLMGGSIYRGSIENIPPVHPEDSLTESESDSDMLRLKMKDNSSNSYSPTCGSGRGKLFSIEADSATEAESDTEIRHCVEQISKKRRSEHHFGGLREDTPPPLVISPLVSPAKSRVVAVSPMDSPTRKGFRSRIQGSSYPSTVEHRMQSESLPSVVRDFIRMFPGDESYPADFPESLRI